MATFCGVWIVAIFFSLPKDLSKDLCYESIILVYKTRYKFVSMSEFLVFFILLLCVIAFTYILTAHHLVESYCSMCERTQNPPLHI